jgi:FKBP-type peptidyl-prolyl cis-trans isomerase
VNPLFPARSKEDFVRKSVALIVAAGFVAVTAGCSSIPQANGCDPITSPGDASSVVTAEGKIGTEATVSFPTPVITKKIETSTVTVGSGDKLLPGQVADIQFSVYNGLSGEFLGSTHTAEQPARITVGDESNPTAEALQCQTVGSRIATVLTVEQMYGADTLDPSLGLANDDTLVIVSDIERGYLGRADGALQTLQGGLPAVVTAPDGTPGITLPNENPPTDLRIAKIRDGDGATVKQGDQAVVHYTGVIWGDGGEGSVFDSSWERKQPSTLLASALSDTETSGLVPGFAEALIGQTVGSQVLVVIPPEFGYPEGTNPASVPAGSTMVFVFDVLGIQ